MMQTQYVKSASGLLLPEYHQPKQPIAIDLFCGCGGFSLGMIQGGFKVVAAVEQDPHAALTYLKNLGGYPLDLRFIEESESSAPRVRQKFEKLLKQSMKGKIQTAQVSGSNRADDIPGVEHFWLGDIRKLSGLDILQALGLSVGEVDCVFGGPPCQGFSKAGKRDVMDERNSLIFEFARMILEIKPKSLVMENVPGILSMVTTDGIPVIDAFCQILSDGGFAAHDALVRSIKAQQGSWGTVKGTGKSPSQKKEPEIPENSQLSFFE
jgi:DNA (cytosine-5)-methyltransferase 1